MTLRVAQTSERIRVPPQLIEQLPLQRLPATEPSYVLLTPIRRVYNNELFDKKASAERPIFNLFLRLSLYTKEILCQ